MIRRSLSQLRFLLQFQRVEAKCHDDSPALDDDVESDVPVPEEGVAPWLSEMRGAEEAEAIRMFVQDGVAVQELVREAIHKGAADDFVETFHRRGCLEKPADGLLNIPGCFVYSDTNCDKLEYAL